MKLRLPHKFQAALMAALASVSFTTLSTGTLTVAAGAAFLAGQQAWAQVTSIHPMQQVVVAGETYTSTAENGVLVTEGNNGDSAAINLSPYTTAEYLVLTSTSNGRYKVNDASNLANFGTVVLAAGSYEGESGTVNFSGGQIIVNSGVTITNNLILGTFGYSESNDWAGTIRMGGNNTFSGKVDIVQDTTLVMGGNATFTGSVNGAGKKLKLNKTSTLTFAGDLTLTTLDAASASVVFSGSHVVISGTGTDQGIHQAGATITVGGGAGITLMELGRLEMGDAQNSSSSLNVRNGATLKITGSNNGTGYKAASFVLGEWSTATTATIEGTVLSKDADVRAGDKGGTINIAATGTLAAKGILNTKDTGSFTVNVNGGRLVLGSDGNAGQSLNLNSGAALGLYAASANITGPTALNGLVTFDTQMYAFAADGNSVGHATSGTTAINVTGNATIAGGAHLSVVGGGSVSFTGSSINTAGRLATDGTLGIGTSSTALSVAGTIANSGSLSLAGALTLPSAGVYEIFGTPAEGDFDGTGEYAGSGYRRGNNTQYYLVHGADSSSVTTNFTSVTGGSIVQDAGTAGKDVIIKLAEASESDKTYYVNTNVNYGSVMADATSIVVTPTGTLSIGGNDAANLLNTKITGSGTVVINASTSLPAGTSAAPYTTLATGTLRVAANTTLTVGTDKSSHYYDLSSFSAVELGDGALIRLKQRPGLVLNNVSVASGTAHIGKNDSDDTYDKDIDAATLRGTTLVNGELQMGTNWKWQMSVDKLKGSGTLVARGSNETHRLIINGFDGTFGTLKYTGNNTEIYVKGSGTITNLDNTGNSNSLKLDNGVTLEVLNTAKANTLDGAGTIVVDATKTWSLGAANTWTGTLRLHGNKNGSIGNFVGNANSTVELTDLNGWTGNWNGEITQNIKLTNGTTGYAWQNGAFGGSANQTTPTATFSGNWSGDGMFKVVGSTTDRSMNYTYTGDVSRWTGEFNKDGKQTTILTFSQNANEVNAVISKASGAATFTVAAATDVVFNKAVTADAFTLSDGKTATFNAAAKLGNATATGGAILQGQNGALELAGLTKSGDGALTLSGFSKLGSTITLSGGSLVFGAGEYDLTATPATHSSVYSEGDHGYATTTDVVQLVSTGANVSTSGATFKYTSGGETVTADTVAADGTVCFAHAQDNTTYYLVDGTSVDLVEEFPKGMTKVVVLNGTGTIDMTDTWYLQNLDVRDNATANITSTGAYALILNGETTLGANAHVNVDSSAVLNLAHAGTAAAVLKAATGAGNIDLDVNATLGNGTTTAATGKLTIADGKTLTLGGGDSNNVDISSFSQVVLNGGNIIVDSTASTIQGLTVGMGKTGVFLVNDLNAETYQLAGVTRADGNLTVANNWNAQVQVDALVGAGTFSVSGNNGGTVSLQRNAQQKLVLTINSLSSGNDSFTGDLVISHNTTAASDNLDTFTINTGDQAVTFRSMTVDFNQARATAPLAFNLGADATMTGAMTLTSGNVAVTGAHTLTVGGLTGSGALNVAGNLTINVAEGGAYTYGGLQSLGGKLTMSGAGAQTLTLGTEQNPFLLNEAIDLTGGTLTLGGRITLKDGAFEPSGEGSIKYVDLQGTEHDRGEGSGYEAASGDVTVVAVSEDAHLNVGDATFTYMGKVVNVDNNGIFSQTGDPDYERYYIFTDTVSLAAVQTESSAHESTELTSVYLNEGGTLTGDSATQLPTLHVVATEAAGDAATLACSVTTAVATVTGEGTLSVEGTVNVDALNIESGKTLTFAGSGNINVTNLVTAGTIGIAEGAQVNATGNVTLAAGHITTTGAGTLHINNLHVNGSEAVVTLGSVNDLHQITMGAGTVNLNGNTTMERFVLSLDNAASTMNIGAGATVHVTGTTLSVGNNDASFMVSNWNQTNTLNIAGTLIAEAGISSRDGRAEVNVQNGGTLELHKGLLYTSNSNGAVNINVQDGGTLLTAGNETDGTAKGLHVNLGDGSTLQGYYGNADSISIVQALTFTGTTTGATIDVASGKTIKLATAISGSGKMSVDGGGTLQVSGTDGTNFHDVAVADGTTVELIGKDRQDYRLRYTLDGGTLTSSGSNTGGGNVQNDQITLTKSSTISGTANFYMLGGSYNETSLDLGGFTLTKEGTNTVSLINTDVSTGSIVVKAGTLEFLHHDGKADSRVQANIELNGGTISGIYNYTASDSAVTRNLTVTQSAVTNATIGIGDNVTLNANVASGQILTLGGAITGTGNFSLSGEGTLKLAGADMIRVNDLTLGAGATLDVSNVTQIAGVTVSLASYTGAVSYDKGMSITGVESGLSYTLNDTNGQLTLTFAGEQPLPSHFTPTDDLGNVMYVGDSITDGVTGQKSWRYSFFQVLADGGISQNEEGYFQHRQTSGAITTTTYGGRDFENNHSAQASARSWETAGTKNGGRYDSSNIMNWLGQSTTKTNGQAYPTDKPVYSGENAPNTYFMLLGTNDLLSEGGNHVTEQHFSNVAASMFGYRDGAYDGETGTFDIILDSMLKARSDAQLVVMAMPTWSPNHGNHQDASDFAYMAKFNRTLAGWAANNGHASQITVVDPNPGIIDVANTSKPGAGVPTMYVDNLHPNAQGELIIAGNIAKQLGYAGRTVGLDRASYTSPGTTTWVAAANTSITVAAGAEPQNFAQDAFTTGDGYTIDFGAVYGNGAVGGWSDKANALTVQVGDGYNTGTLTFSEAYVMWGNTILYSRDNSQVGDNFRIAYVNQSVNEADHVSTGYYVWMGDQLIGEALSGGSSSFNGIQLTSTGANGTVKNLTWSDTAYAPTTTLYENPDSEALFHLVQDNVLPTHDSKVAKSLQINFTDATENNNQYGTTGQAATGDLLLRRTGTHTNSWFGPVGAAHEGNVSMLYDNLQATTNIFGAINGSVTNGNVSVVLDNGTHIGAGTYDGTGNCSIIGTYQQSIGGDFRVEINNATLDGGIIMGVGNGNAKTVANTLLYINSGASIGGDVFGGNYSRTSNNTITGDATICITGGTVNGSVYGGNKSNGTIGGNTNITITGGVITGDVNGGGTGGTVTGSTNVTVEGILPYIKGNINAQNVTLKDVVNAEGYTDGFDSYAGSITASSLTLDNYKVDKVLAALDITSLAATNGTATAIDSLGTAKAVAISVDADSSLTLGDVKLASAITNDGTLTLNGDVLLDEMTATHTDESYQDGAVEGNGFYSSKSSVTLFADGHMGTVNASTATMTYKGAEGTYDDATGVFTTTEVTKDLTTFYINKEAENLTTVTAVNPNATVTMANGTKLVVDAAMSSSRIILKDDARGTLDIQNGITVTSDGQGRAITLAGEGTYKLQGGVRSLESGVQLGQNWTGSVEVSGDLGNRECSFDGLANTNSTVLMSGAYFWWNPSAVSAQNANIRLNDAYQDNGQSGTANTSALQISGTNANSNYIFTGAFTGAGDFAYVNANSGDARNAHFYLRGNLSGWTGDFVNYNGNTGTHPTLDLDGTGAVEMGGGIIQRGTGALDVRFGGNNTESVTVGGAITKADGSTLTLTANKATTFNSDVTANTLTANANAGVTANGELHVNSAALNNGSSLAVNGADNTLGTVSVAANATATATVGEDVQSAAATNTNVGTRASLTVNGNTAAADFGAVNVGEGATFNVKELGDAASVKVADVTIGAGATMGVYTGSDVSAVDEAALQIASGKTLTAAGEGATLNANLVMDSGSTLDVTGTNGAGLLMGSTVTLNTGMTLNDYSSEWSAWEDGTKYALFTGVDGLNIGSDMGTAAIDYTAWVDAQQYFTNIEDSNRYFLCYEGAPAANAEGLLTGVGTNGANVGMVYIMVMPEPTTSTLSLLALCALAARRRRK